MNMNEGQVAGQKNVKVYFETLKKKPFGARGQMAMKIVLQDEIQDFIHDWGGRMISGL